MNTTKQLFPGREKLVNAILRNALRGMADMKVPPFETDPVGHISVVHSHPRWLVERWIGSFGIEETLELCRADNEIPPISLRVNGLRATREEMLERLARSGHDVKPAVYSPEGIILAKPLASLREMPEVASGFLYVQDEASQLVSRLLAPRRGERVLDLCAGSGGKTTHLAALMENEGEIVAADIQPGKLAALESTAKRWGIAVVKTAVVDAADAAGPSGLGSFRPGSRRCALFGSRHLEKKPGDPLASHRTEDLGSSRPCRNASLQTHAACVRKGGLLLYSTCSVMPEENDGVVEAFLEGHPDFTSVARRPTISRLTSWSRRDFFGPSPTATARTASSGPCFAV